MRQHEYRRDPRAAAKVGKPRARIEPTNPRRQVLRLQRLAGNAAVTELLTPDRVVPRDGGRPLEPMLQREMEASLGHDLSDVRLHENADAARAVGAHAYTVGTDIVFGSSKYDKRRLTHELVHVVQQAHGPVEGTEVAPGVTVSDPSDRHEREAEAVAGSVRTEENASVDGAPASSHGVEVGIQREEGGESKPDGQESAESLNPKANPSDSATQQSKIDKLIVEVSNINSIYTSGSVAGPEIDAVLERYFSTSAKGNLPASYKVTGAVGLKQVGAVLKALKSIIALNDRDKKVAAFQKKELAGKVSDFVGVMSAINDLIEASATYLGWFTAAVAEAAGKKEFAAKLTTTLLGTGGKGAELGSKLGSSINKVAAITGLLSDIYDVVDGVAKVVDSEASGIEKTSGAAKAAFGGAGAGIKGAEAARLISKGAAGTAGMALLSAKVSWDITKFTYDQLLGGLVDAHKRGLAQGMTLAYTTMYDAVKEIERYGNRLIEVERRALELNQQGKVEEAEAELRKAAGIRVNLQIVLVNLLSPKKTFVKEGWQLSSTDSRDPMHWSALAVRLSGAGAPLKTTGNYTSEQVIAQAKLAGDIINDLFKEKDSIFKDLWEQRKREIMARRGYGAAALIWKGEAPRD